MDSSSHRRSTRQDRTRLTRSLFPGRLFTLRALVLAGGLLVVFAGQAWADTTIDFDGLSPGAPVTNQYAAQGVVFGALPGGASESAPPTVTSAPGQAHSGSQVADINCFQAGTCPNEGIGTYIPEATGTFSQPRSRVSVYVGLLGSAASPCAADSAATCAAVTLVAVDSSGNEVASSGPAILTQGAGVQTQLSVSVPSPEIAGFEVVAQDPTDNAKDVAIDDLSFDLPSQPPPPDFTLTPQSTTVTVSHGQSVNDQIAIGRIGGSTGQIQFSTGALPAGIQAQLAPNPADTQTTLTLTAARTVPPGSGTVTITGTPLSASGGGSAHSVVLHLQIESACDDVLTAQDLIDALGSGCRFIHVDDAARIDLAYVSLHPDQFPGYDALHNNELGSVLHIPAGVTLESDRSTRHAGGVLSLSQNLPYTKAMLELSSGDRVTGLRLLGYSFGRGGDETYTIGDTYGTEDGLNVSQPNVLIDNNEIAGWPGSGVLVHDLAYPNWPPAGGVLNERYPPRHSSEDDLITGLASEVHITDNYIHNNVGCTDGYGVNVGGNSGFALINRNVFDYNKHDVAGGGQAGTGYIASSNLSLTDGVECRGDSGMGSLTYGGHFDMHGTAPGSGHVGGIAGTYIEVRNNAIRGDQRFHIHLGHAFDHRSAFDIRGTPTDKAIFAGNVTEASGGDAISISGADQVLLESHNKLLVDGNSYGVNTSQQLAVGDFDGDGCSDVFLATGAVWVYSPCGTGIWRYLNTSGYRLGQLAFGDFNGDGKTDVFTQRGDRWYVSYGGKTAFQLLPAGSNIPMKDYRFGDFDGDGKTDIFRANGRQFYYSDDGASPWKPLASSSKTIGELRFCDFNGDGRTDVFSLANHQWSVSYGGRTQWHRLNAELSSNLNELVFADFNGDGRCDIVRAHGRGFQISWGGTTAWDDQPTRYQADATFAGTLLGNFNGGRAQDILRFELGGHALERFSLSSDFGPFNDFWSQQNML